MQNKTSSLRKMAGKGCLAISMLSLSVASALSHAEEAAAEGVDFNASVFEKITVTSQKREQFLDDVSIAVTAFSAPQMEMYGIEDSIDLIDFAPNVSRAGDLGGQRSIFNIRGVVQNDYADIAEAPVAVYVDGGYLASTQAQTFGMFDIQRVEILKGPQGTLFGRNATGGLVNTITAKPTEYTEGYAEFTAARFGQLRFETAISGELSDSVRGRFALMTNKMDNILDNIYEDGADPDPRLGSVGGGQDGYNDDTKAIRAQLEFDLGEDGTALLAGNWSDTVKSEGPYQVVNTTEILDANGNVIDVIFAADDPMGCDRIQGGNCVDGNFDGNPFRPGVGTDFNGNIDPDGSGVQVNKDFAFDDQNKFDSKGLMLTIDYFFENMDFVSVTDYKKFTRTVGLDSDQTASPELIFQSDGETTQLSQEFRFSGSTDNYKWVGGLFYLGIETDYLQGLAASPTAGFLAGEEANTIANIDTDSYSIFGQIDYNLTDELVLVAGARLVQEDKALEGRVIQNANTNDRLVEVDYANGTLLETANLENNQDLWSAKVQLDYSPNDDALYYFGINRGVKAGSFNAPLFGGYSSYDPEVLLSYEAGAKLTFMEGKMQFNSSVFYYDYSDYQSFSWVNNAGVVFNEEATFTGAEIEIFLNAAKGLDIMFNASYIDAVVEDLQVADGDFRDTTPPYTPEYQASGMIRYSWSVGEGNMAAVLSGSYQSETFHNARNFTAHKLDSQFKANANLTWKDSEDMWNVVVYVDNLTDEDDGIIGFDVSGFYGNTQIAYTKPRTYGITVRRNF
ncbi:TonB-dependent receptor [Paraneptunicella aestuarii]|uniref:TonB-dependent receptor n=1 Tax=Paraneptunicella aestuarii TaxID=2831148 RepID=UPI001E3C67F3|nr:TonB-dependent receptor [Paraneptunicella aestuarii]